MTSYGFSVSSGFATPENIDLIRNDILTKFPTNVLLSINSSDGFVEVVLQNQLTNNDDLLTLYYIFSQKDVVTSKNIVQKYTPETRTLNNTNFTKIGRFLFKGVAVTNEIRGIDIVCNMDTGATEYSIQLVNRKTNDIIAQATFNNTDVELLTMSLNKQLPQESCIIDVLAKIKRSGLKTYNAYIDEINLWN